MRILLVALLLAPGAMAHHSFAAEFDASNPVRLEGTVTRMDWINPHAYIFIDVKDANGNVTPWMVECGSPNTLFRKGLPKDALPAGTRIVIDGYRSKDGKNRANGRNVVFADGRKVFLGSSSGSADDK